MRGDRQGQLVEVDWLLGDWIAAERWPRTALSETSKTGDNRLGSANLCDELGRGEESNGLQAEADRKFADILFAMQ